MKEEWEVECVREGSGEGLIVGRGLCICVLQQQDEVVREVGDRKDKCRWRKGVTGSAFQARW